MTYTRSTAMSRPASSRATSVAQGVLRRRDRPYRTEQTTVRVKKRKLDIHTSYKKAPSGYTFLPVGTPDLADLCKEMSRQRGLPVNVVNAKPMSKHAIDPQKVSHHIHRIGYHFKSEIVDEASQQLGYVYYRGKFIKEDVMQAQRSKGRIKNIMAKYGLNMRENDARETPEQVSAYIKELFPRIPQDDLEKIVQHAWEEGSKRVGTNENMNLANRVQLAVTARIRHAYTDYDRLLKAFEWKDARQEVEAECVRKLKEWRGEDGTDDEEKGFEEAVADVIVIDDDDDPMQGNGADDSEEDDASVGDTEYVSDDSVEIVEHHMSDSDFAAEGSIRQSRPSTHLSQREWAGQQQARESPRPVDRTPQVREVRYEPSPYPHPLQPVHYAYPPQPQQPQYRPIQVAQPVYTPTTPQRYQARPDHGDLERYLVHPQQPPLQPQQQPYTYQYHPLESREQQSSRLIYAPDPYQHQPPPAPQDRAVPSIERDDEPQQPPPQAAVYSYPQGAGQPVQYYSQRPSNIVDLTTPPPPAAPPPPQYRMFAPVHGAPHPAQYFPR